MAWNKFVTLITILVVLLPTITAAKEFVVGDDSGWKTNFDYQAWAKDKVFRVGDTLVFNYKAPNHNVFKVNGTGFKECIKATENEAPLSSGNDKIDLQTSGNKWYICSVKDHCDLGMKLFITVSDESSAVRGITLSGSYQAFMAVIMAITAIAALST
ncbi:stellacyanin-like [Prunus avium]|uniref:Stellacyanin-like n=1 Tax=Prunus avium TaxID=42229 RepID=A0A6P5S8T4_PRUAV|nr:stellacyanin-like [Prunus avium]